MTCIGNFGIRIIRKARFYSSSSYIMETQNGNQAKTELGCLLTGTLICCLLEAIIMILFFGVDFIVHLAERSFIANLVSGLAALIVLASLYFIIISFWRRKIGPIGLMVELLIWSVLLLIMVVIPTPTTPEQKAGAFWGLVFLIVNLLFIVILGVGLKRFNAGKKKEM